MKKKNRWPTTVGNSVDESKKHNIKWKKVLEDNIKYETICIKLKNKGGNVNILLKIWNI